MLGFFIVGRMTCLIGGRVLQINMSYKTSYGSICIRILLLL